MATTRLTIAVAALAALVGGAIAADTDLATREARVYAAAILHAARGYKCTTKMPCCFSVNRQQPSEALLKELRGQPHLRPIQPHAACAELTLDAVRVTSDKPEREAVAIGAGSETAPFLFCTFFLRLTSSGWKVMPSETMCPVT